MGAISPVRMEARHYEREGGSYRCGLCPHRCLVPVGGYGRCGTRRGDEDMLVACTYGRVSSMCVDPVEKKPLYHYRPGSRIFSAGGVGCNMSCRHCQNYSISQSPAGKKRTTYVSPQELASLCQSEGSDAIAFTYNEPVVWFEYIMDVMRCRPDLKCVLVTNGLCEDAPLRELCAVSDAVNMDVKGFTEGFYEQVCGARLADVLRSAETVFREGVHLELTYLVIPGLNDSRGELEGFSSWAAERLSPDVPVHFTRFHPDNMMEDVPWTPAETLSEARRIAMDAGLNYVYVGNILSEGESDTYCPGCGADVIERTGYLVDAGGVSGGRCRYCRHGLNLKG